MGIPWESLLFSLVMRGHLEDRGKNVWRAKVYAGRQGDGRRVYVTRTIHGTKRFAEGKLAELLMKWVTPTKSRPTARLQTWSSSDGPSPR